MHRYDSNASPPFECMTTIVSNTTHTTTRSERSNIADIWWTLKNNHNCNVNWPEQPEDEHELAAAIKFVLLSDVCKLLSWHEQHELALNRCGFGSSLVVFLLVSGGDFPALRARERSPKCQSVLVFSGKFSLKRQKFWFWKTKKVKQQEFGRG